MDNNFFPGALIGLIFGVFLVLILSKPCSKIISKTILTPSIELTTDGKTIDTLYIYKQIK